MRVLGQRAPAQPAPLAHFGCSSALCDLDSPWIPSHGCGKLRARSAPFLVYPLNLTCKCPSWQLGGQFDSLVKSVLGGEGGRERQGCGCVSHSVGVETGCLFWG